MTVHDFGDADGLYYIVMEYVDGVNLRDVLTDGKMEPEQALAIVPPVCEALEYAHGKGVVHRDIKPENLLLDRDGRVKIADFGIASLVGSTTEISGTPSYMAPEQLDGHVDRRADIYALGVVLYEMLTGQRPDKEIVAPSRTIEVDVKIDEIVLRALEKEPGRRYQTAAEFRTTTELAMKPHQVKRSLPRWAESWIQIPTARRRAMFVTMLAAGLGMAIAFWWPAWESTNDGTVETWSYGLREPWYEYVRDYSQGHRISRVNWESKTFFLGVVALLHWTWFSLLCYAESKAGGRLRSEEQVFTWKLVEEYNGQQRLSAGTCLKPFSFMPSLFAG